MNLTEARKILGLNENDDQEVARKAFKVQAKKFHPDTNKDPAAEAKFKQINEAYEVLKSGKASTREEQQAEQGFPGNIWGGGQGFNIQDLFNNLGATSRPNRKRIIAHDISLPQTLTFKEAVIGCQKEITYTHNIKCTSCQGAGQKPIDNGCSVCKGSGQEHIKRDAYSTLIRPCSKCRGKATFENCSTCKSEGYLSMNSTISVNIPPGATEGALLNLGPRGHYIGDIMGSEQTTRLMLQLSVMPQSDLILQEPTETNLRVVHQLHLSLTEALTGCTKTVPSIDGPQEITISPLSKHQDEVLLPNLGIGRQEAQVIILNIHYPSDISSLLQTLTPEN